MGGSFRKAQRTRVQTMKAKPDPDIINNLTSGHPGPDGGRPTDHFLKHDRGWSSPCVRDGAVGRCCGKDTNTDVGRGVRGLSDPTHPGKGCWRAGGELTGVTPSSHLMKTKVPRVIAGGTAGDPRRAASPLSPSRKNKRGFKISQPNGPRLKPEKEQQHKPKENESREDGHGNRRETEKLKAVF